MALGLVAATAVPMVAHAQSDGEVDQTPSDGDYVTTTTAAEPSLDVSAFAPVCIRDAPFINYSIVPVGFTPVDGTATLVIRAANGTLVDTVTVTSLTGQLLWPGASVDAAGNATDWPGWRLAADGVSWEPDPSDSFLRDGLSIEVTVNPTATATVTYPPATEICANPPTVPPSEPPCVPGQDNDGTPEDDCDPTPPPCVPGQDNDANPDDDCELPRTGGGPGNLVLGGAGALLAGLLLFTATRRRRGDMATG